MPRKPEWEFNTDSSARKQAHYVPMCNITRIANPIRLLLHFNGTIGCHTHRN